MRGEHLGKCFRLGCLEPEQARDLRAALAASEAAREKAEGERDELRLAILGGEDVPGVAATVSIEQCVDYLREERGRANDVAWAWDISRVRPLDEWHEDDGDVLWWHPGEAPHVGSPLDTGFGVPVSVGSSVFVAHVGGWPGYHQWWTPLQPIPYGATPAGLQALSENDNG